MAVHIFSRSLCRHLNQLKHKNFLADHIKINNSHKRHLKEWQLATQRLMYERSKDPKCAIQDEKHRSEWQDWNYKSELFSFIKRLGEDIPDENLHAIFIDSSYVTRETDKLREFGEDAIELHLTPNDELSKDAVNFMSNFIKSYIRYFLRKLPEDFVSSLTSFLMSDDVLGEVAQKIGCSELVLCSDLSPSNEVLAKVVRALVATLVKTKCEKHAEKFIIDFLMSYLCNRDLMDIWNMSQNYQEILNDLLNRNNSLPFEARLLRESGRNTLHASYVIGLYVEKKLIGIGPGESFKVATEMAAYDAIQRIFEIRPHNLLFKFGLNAYNLNYENFQNEHPYLEQWQSTEKIYKLARATA